MQNVLVNQVTDFYMSENLIFFRLDNLKREMLYINLYLAAKIKTDGRDAENFGCRR
jgi:hypothetical protein